jgi:tellurite methyltransferase
MSRTDSARWDKKWREREGGDDVPSWLVRHQSMLGAGIAVDLATGRGASAAWLAQFGYHVLAVDISRVALIQAKERTATRDSGNPLFIQADLDEWRLPADSVDLIAVFRFLDRSLFPMMMRAARPRGLLICQTRTVGWLEREPDASREYLLQRGELLRLVDGWTIAAYQESAMHAAIVARRPAMETSGPR